MPDYSLPEYRWFAWIDTIDIRHKVSSVLDSNDHGFNHFAITFNANTFTISVINIFFVIMIMLIYMILPMIKMVKMSSLSLRNHEYYNYHYCLCHC